MLFISSCKRIFDTRILTWSQLSMKRLQRPVITLYERMRKNERDERMREKWSWSLSLRLVYPVLHKLPGATITSRSAVRIRINFWRVVGLYISFGDWANALECWRSPSLRLVIPGIAVSPGVTHSDSRIVFVTGTVVKPQQPTSL